MEMEIYSLGDDFLPRKLIQPYISAIWTERYTSAGDFQLVVQSPSILADELSRGRIVALRGSKELMVVETRTVEKGLLTVTGPSLLKFFNQREAWFTNPDFEPDMLPIPEPKLASVQDFSGNGPLSIVIDEISEEEYDARTVVYVIVASDSTGASGDATPVIDHPNGDPIMADTGGAIGGTPNLMIGQESWRLLESGDREFVVRNRDGVDDPINIIVRVFVLRGLSAAVPSFDTYNNFTAGFGTNPPSLPAQNTTFFTEGRRWLAFLGYERSTPAAGHTPMASSPISGGDAWTDQTEQSFDATSGKQLRIRTAIDFATMTAGHRPGAVFHPGIEWSSSIANVGSYQIIGLGIDTAQPKRPPSTPLYADYSADWMRAGEFLASMVSWLLIYPTDFSTPYEKINLDWADEVIPGLDIGNVDFNGPNKELTFPIGPIYDGIEKLATEQHLGVKLYLESASAGSFVLRFASYRGMNRTGNQDQTRLIRMSPDLDSLLNSKEFVSSENYKNLVYVTYKNEVTMHYASAFEPQGFNRRVIRVDAPEVHIPSYRVPAYRVQVAWNTLIRNAGMSAVDGQLQTVSGHKFTHDYFLGDVIELKGNDGVLAVAQVTEHIRSQDQYGLKEYPTLSIIDPALFNFDDDLTYEPSRDWIGDPDYDISYIYIPPEG
jgi:Siphovirus ReqiPepy6 Gp37-like protein